MATRSSDIPNHSERTILQAILQKTQIPPGERTIATLLAKGWIEERPQVNGTQKYSVTPAGEAALKIKIPFSR
jgi:hypothetical protein